MTATLLCHRAAPLRARALRSCALSLLLLLLPSLSRVSPAAAEPRFGDSTWAAPNAPLRPGDPTEPGPRVAPPDHERTWETVMRAPFRLAFLPLRVVARGGEAAANRWGDKIFNPQATEPRRGLHVGPAIKVGRVNDVGIGPGITWVGFPARDATLNAHATWSSIDRRLIKISEVVGLDRPVGFDLTGAYDHRPNRRYYGIGNATPETNRSYFLGEETRIESRFRIGRSPVRQLRLVGGYSDIGARRGSHGTPLLEEIFAPQNVPYFHQGTRDYLYGVTGELALLDDDRDPSEGVHGLFEGRHYMGLDSSDPDYNEWLVEGRAYVPVFSDRRVIALRGAYAGVEPTSGTTVMPFYRLAMSDGPLRFAGYASQRFRDRRLALAHAEYRWAVWRRLNAMLLYEWGLVAPRASEFTLADAHKSYGGGFRLGTGPGKDLRIQFAKSNEGWHGELHMGTGF